MPLGQALFCLLGRMDSLPVDAKTSSNNARAKQTVPNVVRVYVVISVCYGGRTSTVGGAINRLDSV